MSKFYRSRAFSGTVVRPITEGYDQKGGQNTVITIAKRPPPPAPMKYQGNDSPASYTSPKSGHDEDKRR